MKTSKRSLYESIWNQKLETGQSSLTNRITEALKEIDSGYRLLDIGCGDGSLCALARSKYRCAYGIDGSTIALESAIANGASVILADLDGNFLPFCDDKFDLVSCLDVIEHVFDPEKLAREIYRVLTKNGILILTSPNIRFIDFVRSLLLYGHFPRTSQDIGGYDGGHLHYFTFRDIRALLSKTGFQIVKERGYDEKHYFSPKVLLFKMIIRFWERDLKKEFFSPGILFKAKKL